MITFFRRRSFYSGLACSIFFAAACGTQTGTRALQGAAAGAAVSAAGSVVSALIFGGDVGDAAARAAVWGATTGAVSGAIVGSREDQAAAKKQQDAAIKKLKSTLGEDAYDGLTALAQCKHPVALGYAQTAKSQKNKSYRLAGLWLEAVTKADQGGTKQARKLFPEIIAADPEVSSESEARKRLQEGLQGLRNIRTKHKLPAECKK